MTTLLEDLNNIEQFILLLGELDAQGHSLIQEVLSTGQPAHNPTDFVGLSYKLSQIATGCRWLQRHRHDIDLLLRIAVSSLMMCNDASGIAHRRDQARAYQPAFSDAVHLIHRFLPSPSDLER